MKILLVFPGLGFERSQPLGLCYLAAALKAAGHEVHGYDAAIHRLDGLQARARALAPDVVGLSVWSANLTRAATISAALGPLPLVVGGPHATLRPEETLRRTGAVAAVLGDGERTMVELLAAGPAALRGQPEALRQVPGLAWRGPDVALERSVARAPIEPLDSLPLPDREIFPIRSYGRTWSPRAPLRAPVITSRGCPCRCAHCAAPALHSGSWRPRSPVEVLRELELLHREHGVGHVLIEDDHLSADRERLLSLCAAIEPLAATLSWGCPNGMRAETLDRPLLEAMARGGCTQIALGVESPVPDQRGQLGRAPGLEPVRAACAHARELGIAVTLYFMLDSPGEPRGSGRGALRLATSLGVTTAHFSQFAPVPGSALEHRPGRSDTAARARRALLYLGFYGHPRRAGAVLRHARAGLSDLPAAAAQLARWIGPEAAGGRDGR